MAEYYNDLTHMDGSSLNIVKVYLPHNYDEYTTKKAYNEEYLVWERKEEVKEISMKDVEEKFGCKVKIVG